MNINDYINLSPQLQKRWAELNPAEAFEILKEQMAREQQQGFLKPLYAEDSQEAQPEQQETRNTLTQTSNPQAQKKRVWEQPQFSISQEQEENALGFREKNDAFMRDRDKTNRGNTDFRRNFPREQTTL